MSEHEQHTEDRAGEEESRARRLLRTFARPIGGAILGVLLGVACSQLPPTLQAPCEMVSHLLPQACGGDGKIP